MYKLQPIFILFGLLSIVFLGLGIYEASGSFLWTTLAVVFIGMPCVGRFPIVSTLTLGITQLILGGLTWHFWGMLSIWVLLHLIAKNHMHNYLKRKPTLRQNSVTPLSKIERVDGYVDINPTRREWEKYNHQDLFDDPDKTQISLSPNFYTYQSILEDYFNYMDNNDNNEPLMVYIREYQFMQLTDLIRVDEKTGEKRIKLLNALVIIVANDQQEPYWIFQ